MKNKIPRCAKCTIPDKQRICRIPGGIGPKWCPTKHYAEAIDGEHPRHWNEEQMKFSRQASIQERAGYHIFPDGNRRPAKTRIEEIGEFAIRMNFKILGLAFCAGLQHEAYLAAGILENWGFNVASVMCKVGCVDKSELNLSDEFKLNQGPEHETMCHPSAQAEVMNQVGTDLNIILGLCVGHDSTFIKHSEAPVTVLVAKDRVTGHNPVASLFTSNSYYRSMAPENLDTLERDENGQKI